jgi:hypothetical protein
LNKIIDLKSEPKGINKEKIFSKEGLLIKEIFSRGKTKFIYFAGGKNLFTLKKITLYLYIYKIY